MRLLAKSRETISLNAISREHEFRVGPTGVIHILGVKLTDYRRATEELVGQIVRNPPALFPDITKKVLTRKMPLELE